MKLKLRDCAICGAPVFPKKYQSNAARTCTPVCARTLAAREHPDIETVPDRRLRLLDGKLPS